MTAIDRLLSRLDRVKQTGPNTWMAATPTRDERTPSLSIKQVDDRILIHDHGGDDTATILAAIGLTMADLFDKPLEHNRAPLNRYQRRRIDQAADALRALRYEALIVLVAGDRLASGFGINGDDMDRLHKAHGRILATHQEIFGQPILSQHEPGQFIRTITQSIDAGRAAAERLEVAQ